MSLVGVDGVELFCRERGDGPPLLLVHGMGGDAEIWGRAFDGLAEGHRTIAYDRRGFSRSAHPPVADLCRHGDDAAALLKALDASPATVLGWSSGGLIALDVAVRHPEAVAALVLVEAPLHAARRPGLRQARAAVAARLRSRLQDDRAGSETFLRWALRYRTGGTGFDRLPESVCERMLANGPASMADLRAGTGEHLSAAQVAAIDRPVTCLLGERSDPAFARAARRTARMVPRAQVVRIAAAGHAMHLDRLDEFVAAVHDAAAAA